MIRKLKINPPVGGEKLKMKEVEEAKGLS